VPSYSYTLSLEDHENYVFARVTPHVVGVETAVTYLNETLKLVREKGARKLLFFREAFVSMPAREYEMIGSIVVNVVPEDVRFALVDRSPLTSMVIDTVNTKAQEGGRDIRAFADIDAARIWLLS
jgi:hypothetical protein